MDFRTFIDQLAASDQLLRIKAEVNPKYELSALVQQATTRGKAIWFERVTGSDYPAVGGVLSTAERHALALGRSPAAMGIPGAWAKAISTARNQPIAALTRAAGPAAEVVIRGDDIDVNSLPVPISFPDDTHRFICSGLGIVMDPDSGIQNVGYYRAPFIDKQTISVSGGMSSRLKQIYQAAADKAPTMPIAYVIGAPPALLITAGCRINRDESDMDIAGALQGHPLELIKCKTNDLLVPAQAEIIIEAEVDLHRMVEHTMGEFPGNYGTTTSPIARITAITHRSNAVYHAILGGITEEHNALGAYIFAGLREQLLEQLCGEFPCVQDIHVDLTPRRMGARCQIAVAINKSADEEPQKLMAAIYEQNFDTFPLAMVVQRIVVVDTDVEITSQTDVEWAIAMRMTSAEKLRVIEARTKTGAASARLAIDATLGLHEKAAGKRPKIPNNENYLLDKYL